LTPLIPTQDVARNRGVDIDTVRAEMADGRVFIGRQAVDAALADAVGGIDDAIDLALSLVPDNAGIFSTGARTPQRQGVTIIAIKGVKSALDTYQSLMSQGQT
jgi:ClpP class serine protease